MKKFVRNMIIVLLAALVFSCASTGPSVALVKLGSSVESQNNLPYSGKTVILHTNDVHGQIWGYAYAAQLKDDFASEGADVILVDAGDYSQGTIYVSTTKGADAVTMMNAAGYDIATLGNHEFDFGYAQLKDNLSKAQFTVLCADVFEPDGSTIFDATTVVEIGGMKIGFLGLETPESRTKVNPALIKGLYFPVENDLYKATQDAIDSLKAQNVDLIIGLVHLGVDAESEPNRSVDVYRNTTGIDFMIDGHSHTVMTESDRGEPIQSTGTAFENIGVIVIDNATKTIEDHYLQPVKDGDNFLIEAKASVAAVCDEITAKRDEEYNIVFAKSLVDLNGEKDPGNRTEETNLGSLIADALKWMVLKEDGSVSVDESKVVAITNGGGIRAAINAGDVTRKDINTVLPFGNTVAVVYVTGAELLEALEASTYCTPTSIGGFPQVSGISFSVDTTIPYNPNDEVYPDSTYYGPKTIERVIISNINDEPFSLDEVYAVITNDFCAAGGDTYYAFLAATDKYDTGIPLDEAFIEYIEDALGGVIGEEYAEPFGRIFIYTD